MIGAFRQAFGFIGLEIGQDQLGFGIVAVGEKDLDVELRRRDRRIAEQAGNLERAGVHRHFFSDGAPNTVICLAAPARPQATWTM